MNAAQAAVSGASRRECEEFLTGLDAVLDFNLFRWGPRVEGIIDVNPEEAGTITAFNDVLSEQFEILTAERELRAEQLPTGMRSREEQDAYNHAIYRFEVACSQ